MEISEQSMKSAGEFVERHRLSSEIVIHLAQLLESTWHEAIRAEQMFSFVERVAGQVKLSED